MVTSGGEESTDMTLKVLAVVAAISLPTAGHAICSLAVPKSCAFDTNELSYGFPVVAVAAPAPAQAVDWAKHSGLFGDELFGQLTSLEQVLPLPLPPILGLMPTLKLGVQEGHIGWFGSINVR